MWTNYRLLQVRDLLGLHFCCQEPHGDHIEPVPVSCVGVDDDGVLMGMKPGGPRQLSFERVPQSTFEDVEAFRRAWFRADVGLMEFEPV